MEARIDARLQEVHSRLILHDGRFAAVGDRCDQTDRRLDALSTRINSQLRAIDRRLGHIETHHRDQQQHNASDRRLAELEQRLDERRNLRVVAVALMVAALVALYLAALAGGQLADRDDQSGHVGAPHVAEDSKGHGASSGR